MDEQTSLRQQERLPHSLPLRLTVRLSVSHREYVSRLRRMPRAEAHHDLREHVVAKADELCVPVLVVDGVHPWYILRSPACQVVRHCENSLPIVFVLQMHE